MTDITYSQAAPLRTTPCLAWLIEYQPGGKDVLFTSADMAAEDVVRMVSNHTHAEFLVRNITVGQLPVSPQWGKPNPEGRNITVPPIPEDLQDFYLLYSNDSRKLDRDLVVHV